MSTRSPRSLDLSDDDVARIAAELGIAIRPDELHEVAVRLASTVEQLRTVMEMDLSGVAPVVVLPEVDRGIRHE